MRRNIIIGLGILLGLIIVGVVIYFLFFAGRGGTVQVGDPTNPFGTAGQYQGQGEAPPVGEPQVGAGTEILPTFVKISDGPVAEGIFIQSVSQAGVVTSTSTASLPGSDDIEVRYVERASGNVYSYKMRARTLTRLTNQTVPGVHEAHWSLDGSRVFLRLFSREEKQVETYSLPLEGDEVYFMEDGISGLVVSDDLLTLRSDATGSVATLASVEGLNPRTLFTSLLSSLIIKKAGEGYLVHTKASAHSDGYGFLVSPSGALDRLLGPARGLTLLPSPSGAQVLYSHVASGRTAQLSLLTVDTRETTSLPANTLTEKCAWVGETLIYCAVPTSLTGDLPDAWYQGAVSFTDRIWLIDLEARTASLEFDPKTVADIDIDATSLAVDPYADALVFVNRKDGSLWLYNL